MIIAVLILDAILGFLSHSLAPYIRYRFGNGWRELVSYSAGMMLVSLPLAALEYVISGDLRRVREQMVKYYFIAGAFGTGNFLARLFFE